MARLLIWIFIFAIVVDTARSERCTLPKYPDNGDYTVAGAPSAAPGGEMDYAFLTIRCDPGYSVSGKSLVYCVSGQWSNDMPLCAVMSSPLSAENSTMSVDDIDEQDSNNTCSDSLWRCDDGSCVSLDAQCDGVQDCPDGSDEVLPACNGTQRLLSPVPKQCVLPPYPEDGTYKVSNVPDAGPGQEFESLRLNVSCRKGFGVNGASSVFCLQGLWFGEIPKCELISSPVSAESSVMPMAKEDEQDSNNTCSDSQLRCDDGTCVSLDGQCDGVQDCPDGSDEKLPACSGTLRSLNPAPAQCVLPPYPEDGTYIVSNVPDAGPGQEFESLRLNVTCRKGFGVNGASNVFCSQGVWFGEIPKCELFCKINEHPSVYYNCNSGSGEQRACGSYEPEGTIIRAQCNSPTYYSTSPLPSMKCVNGTWDNQVKCSPALTQNGTNITILIKDKFEIYISGIEYAGSGSVTSNGVNQTNIAKPVVKIVDELTMERSDKAIRPKLRGTEAPKTPNNAYINFNNVINSSVLFALRDQLIYYKK